MSSDASAAQRQQRSLARGAQALRRDTKAAGRVPTALALSGPDEHEAVLLLFGRALFLIPSMVLITLALALLRPALEGKEGMERG